MANPTVVTGCQPGDVLIRLNQGNRLRLRAVRYPAAGELLISEIEAPTAGRSNTVGRNCACGPFRPGTEHDIRDWRPYGRIDPFGSFVSLNAPAPASEPPPQLTLELWQAPVQATEGPRS